MQTKREQTKYASTISRLDVLENKQKQKVEWVGSLRNRLFKVSSIANKLIEFQAGTKRFPKICAFPTEIDFMKHAIGITIVFIAEQCALFKHASYFKNNAFIS